MAGGEADGSLYVAPHDGTMPMTPGEGNALELAARRLERAVAQLEQKITAERAGRPAPTPEAAAPPADLFDADAEAKALQLAAELETARARERALEEAGAQASEALGRAIAEIRAALGDETLISEGVHDDDAGDGDEAADDEGQDLFGAHLDRPEREA
jgi:hypothetical protein